MFQLVEVGVAGSKEEQQLQVDKPKEAVKEEAVVRSTEPDSKLARWVERGTGDIRLNVSKGQVAMLMMPMILMILTPMLLLLMMLTMLTMMMSMVEYECW